MLSLLLLAAVAFADAPVVPADARIPADVGDRAAWTPEQWIDAVDARIAKLPGFRYSVERQTERAGTTVDERWRFVSWGSSFRIDYFGDTARELVCDGKTLVDYVPANRRAMVVHLDQMSADDAVSTVSRVLQKVAVPGIRLGHADGVTWAIGSATNLDDRPVVELLGTGADGGLRYVVDRERLAVLETQITQKGQTVLDSHGTDLREIEPGLWLAHEIALRAPDQGGEVRVTMHLTKVIALHDSPGNLFDTKLDPSIPIEETP